MAGPVLAHPTVLMRRLHYGRPLAKLEASAGRRAKLKLSSDAQSGGGRAGGAFEAIRCTRGAHQRHQLFGVVARDRLRAGHDAEAWCRAGLLSRRSSRPRRSGRALRSRLAALACGAGGTLRSGFALRTLRADRALRTLRADLSSRPGRTLRPHGSLRALHALRASGTGRTGRTDGTGRAFSAARPRLGVAAPSQQQRRKERRSQED